MSEKLQLRITDAALSRDLFPSDYESAGAELARPIKWMAYEVITDRVISTSSDVVSLATLAYDGDVTVVSNEVETHAYTRTAQRLTLFHKHTHSYKLTVGR